ncbi:molybdopterin-dependent oxidoreductase [Paraconexibacter antarcticus]|uniref:Molybdopterin-dependent oxidoreductase n=1 Tax=Paraconexibacter antarcticus TaxID=2949664 RepID=A0ABY5E0Z1_9ACTN|nr:molybdopterin-dependent oxidoreductase [Paraconexibacter antarcticus]UTI66827.1 molybdopterin-dependent oxidoreductase [Paraconexibacter antarcticus]
MVRPARRRTVGDELRAGRSLGEAFEAEFGHLAAGPFAEDAFPSRLHDERVTAVLGVALGVAFLTCFLTGLLSHFAQQPLDVGFLSMPASPAGLYRVTQGVHVAAGTAAIPLLLVKLWSVFPKLFSWPPVENRAQIVERISILPLVAGSIFQLFSGLSNTAHWYPWTFSFTVTHYWTAWIVIGALVAHVGAKVTITRRALAPAARRAPEPPGTGLSRRGLFAATGAAVGAVTLTTVGQTVRPLKDLALLAPRRPDQGPQGLPVNKSAVGARVTDLIADPGYTLTIDGRVPHPVTLTLTQLRALPRHEADLAIACVEGWSAGATWRGVRVRDLLALAGAPDGAEVVVHSVQARGGYRTSGLNAAHARHRDTLLALEVDGATLHPDHGYPVRLIAPNRPGVQQTKWVGRLEVI